MTKKPIDFTQTIETRFSDLDPYGHVNSKHYLDYVISSRWSFAEREFGIKDKDFIAKGVGFYLKTSLVNYKKPIAGNSVLKVSSCVEAAENSTLIVPFTIVSGDKGILHADGVLNFTVLDLTTFKPMDLPEWVTPYFFK